MTSAVKKGTDYEREVVNMFKANGYECVRTARSHGEYDVIAYKRNKYKKICFITMVQCKLKKEKKKSNLKENTIIRRLKNEKKN